jgi:hypothetical protein
MGGVRPQRVHAGQSREGVREGREGGQGSITKSEVSPGRSESSRAGALIASCRSAQGIVKIVLVPTLCFPKATLGRKGSSEVEVQSDGVTGKH